jgi:glycosyltransferase involved in cell wall biosynthesis
MNKDLDSEQLISIILPTLNGSRYIATSIESCLNQTINNFELIIVVDGRTTDNTVEIIERYTDPRIRIVFNPSGAGNLPGSLNIGFSHAKGNLFTWTSDDNYYKNDALEKMFSFLGRNPDVGLVYTGFWFIDENGNIVRESSLHPPDALIEGENPVGSCFLYWREVAEKVGLYDVNFLMVEDAEFWMRIYKEFKVVLVEDRCYYHRFHGESLTIKNYGAYKARRRLVDASKKHFGMSFFRYQEKISEVFIDEAFFAYQKRDYKHVLPCLVRGVVRNPLWLRNKGVYSIGVRSFLNSFSK